MQVDRQETRTALRVLAILVTIAAPVIVFFLFVDHLFCADSLSCGSDSAAGFWVQTLILAALVVGLNVAAWRRTT